MATLNPVIAKKAESVTAIKERFDRAVSAVLLDFRGVDVENITALRDKFRAKGIEYSVVKNTLVRRALAETSLGQNDEFKAQLKGPTAVAWSYEDPSTAAKIIKDFRKEGPEQEKLEIKCGVLSDEVFAAVRVENELATLPSKDEMRAMLLAQLNAPMESLVRQLTAPAQNFAYALDAKVRQEGEG